MQRVALIAAGVLTHIWRVKVGVSGGVRDSLTPSRNAIGLSSLVGEQPTDGVGELSPWRCATGMMGNNSIRHDG